MNTFNRVALVLLLLLAMVLCSVAFIVPLQTLQTVAVQADALADLLARVRPVVRLPVGILVAVIIDLIGILLIVLEVRRPRVKSIQVEQASGGEVTLSVASIADQLKAEIDKLPEILQVKPKVSAKRNGVMVEVDAKIAAETGVPNKAERIVETIRHVVEQKMGLKLARPPKVNIEAVRRASDRRRSMEEPTPAPAPTPAPEPTIDSAPLETDVEEDELPEGGG
jgi:uncharacterized alkaline shock family protein YloU